MVLARMWFPLAVATLGTALLIMTLSISLRFRGVPSLREGAVAATGAIPLRPMPPLVAVVAKALVD